MRNMLSFITFFGLLLTATLLPVMANATDVTVGANWYGVKPDDLDPAIQEANLSAMQKAGIHSIRCGLNPDPPKLTDFLQRAKGHNIRVVWILSVQFPKGTRAPPPLKGFPGRNPGLSQADPKSFRDQFEPLFNRMDALRLPVAAFELDNEINWIGNGDFPVPGSGRLLTLQDLSVSPEGRKIAQGYLQYIKILAVLKDLRDHSKVNRTTPILTAGMADSGSAAQPFRIAGQLVDSTDINTTLSYLRANGMDKLVDGYSVHHYPTSIKVGTKEGADLRNSRMQNDVFTQCGSLGGGKPCWLTEWGFNIDSDVCPVNDTVRTSLVREVRNTFESLARRGRLRGLFFFSWRDDSHALHEDHSNIVRCGVVTDSGRLAIAPM